jgi:hypothetical protein
VELVYENYNALVIGFGPTERPSEAVLSVAVYPRWVSLFFLQAKKLTDPKKILLGKGTNARHVRLDTPGELNDPDVRSLIAEALRRSEAPFRRTPPNLLIIRSVSAKQRSRLPR